MRKLGIIAVLSLLVTAFAAVPALSVTPSSVTTTGGLHFCTDAAAPTVEAVKTGDTAFLTTSGTVCGAGTTAEATLSATALVTVGCITPAGVTSPRGYRRSKELPSGARRSIPGKAGVASASRLARSVYLQGLSARART